MYSDGEPEEDKDETNVLGRSVEKSDEKSLAEDEDFLSDIELCLKKLTLDLMRKKETVSTVTTTY